jgi:hypothetical protein
MPVENTESGHIQHFTRASFSKLIEGAGLEIAEHANGSWFGGDLSYFAFYFFPRLTQITLAAADHLPPQLVSTWYFRCLDHTQRSRQPAVGDRFSAQPRGAVSAEKRLFRERQRGRDTAG